MNDTNNLTVDDFVNHMVDGQGGILNAAHGVGQVAAFKAAAEQLGLNDLALHIESYGLVEFEFRTKDYDVVLIDLNVGEGISEFEMVQSLKSRGIIPFLRRNDEEKLGLTAMN